MLLNTEKNRADADAAEVNRILAENGIVPPYGEKTFEAVPSVDGWAYRDGLFVTVRSQWGRPDAARDAAEALRAAAEALRAAGWYAAVRGPSTSRVWAQRPGVEPRQPLTKAPAEWRQDGPLMADDGSHGGDDQVGKSASKRFAHVSLPGRLVTVYHYPYVDSNAPGGVPDDVRFGVQRVIETMICEDTEDPGGTERSCDYEYEIIIPQGEFATVEEAERAALDLAHEYTGDMVEWDGTPGFDQD